MFSNFSNNILLTIKKGRFAVWLIGLVIAVFVLQFSQLPVIAEDASSTITSDTDITSSADSQTIIETIETLPGGIDSSTPNNSNSTTSLGDLGADFLLSDGNSSSTTGATSSANDLGSNTSSSPEFPSSTANLLGDFTITPPTPTPTSTSTSTSTSTPSLNNLTIPPTEENLSQLSAQSGSGPSILTGDAIATANIFNVINTNIVDSEGFLSFINLFNEFNGDISVSDFNFPLDHCTDNGCNLKAVVSNNSSSTVINNVVVRAHTGSNTSSGTGSQISTGSSVGSANVVNIVNTNIIKSNYLLLALNSFNNWFGDLVLPGKDFFNNLLNKSILGTSSGNASSSQEYSSSTDDPLGNFTTISNESSVNIYNNNSASIVNTVQTVADTGGNTISGSSSTIITGQANAKTNIFTMANTNIFSNDSVFILVRVFGNWSGNIFSTPPGISWKKTTDGILLFSTPVNNEISSQENTNDCCGNNLVATNTNTANVENKIQVYALTGDNEVNGDNSTISTGNADAVTNISNIINTNIVGRNWLFAIANIFGNWEGNLAFGKPDLWIAQRAEVQANPLVAGSEINYVISLANRGNADATQIDISSDYNPHGRIEINNLGGGELRDGKFHWTLPSLAIGASTTLTYSARVGSDLPQGLSTLTTNANVTSFENDANPNDNSDSLAFTIQGPPITDSQGGGMAAEYGNGFPKISMVKTNNVNEPINPSSTVKYELKITNDGPGSAFGVTVEDTLFDPLGTKIATSTWALDTIYPGEEIFIDYDANFSSDASTGYYINVAQFYGDNLYRDDVLVTSASSSIYIINPNDKTTGLGGGGGSTTTTTASSTGNFITGNSVNNNISGSNSSGGNNSSNFNANGNTTSTATSSLSLGALPGINRRQSTDFAFNIALAADTLSIFPTTSESASDLSFSALFASAINAFNSVPSGIFIIFIIIFIAGVVVRFFWLNK